MSSYVSEHKKCILLYVHLEMLQKYNDINATDFLSVEKQGDALHFGICATRNPFITYIELFDNFNKWLFMGVHFLEKKNRAF